MQSKFQSHKMNFRVNFFLDCILDEIFAVYEFYFFNSHGSLHRKNDKLRKVPSQSGLRGLTLRLKFGAQILVRCQHGLVVSCTVR